jgi:hypothetical protein
MYTSNKATYSIVTFDTDGIPFLIDDCANTHVCCKKSLFISELKPSDFHIKTASGPSPELLEGTIFISWEDDNGLYHNYELKKVQYSPEGAGNIIAIGKLGEIFGKSDNPPTCNNNRTWVQSSADYSVFCCFHGKQCNTLQHSAHQLPEIMVNNGNPNFTPYLIKLKKVYNDAITHAFMNLIEINCDEMASSQSPAQTEEYKSDLSTQQTAEIFDYEPGDSILYTDGEGNISAGKYI